MRMRQATRAGILTALVAGLILTAVTPANAATRHRIADRTGRTFATASTTDRNVTMQNPTGRTNQVWEITLLSIGDRITNVLTGGCLAVPANSPAQNPPVIQQACQGTPFERWQRVATSSNTVAFRNVGLQGRCIGIDPASAAPARLLAFPCNFGAANQQFRLMAP